MDYYGAPTPLRQLAGVSVPDNSMLVIQPYDAASLKAIERGITVSDLGLAPNNDGKLIRLNIPQLTAVSNYPREQSPYDRPKLCIHMDSTTACA